MPRNDGYNPTAEQQQNMDNLSFDRKYLVNASENLVENTAGDGVVRMKQPMKDTTATDGSQKTQIVETVPTDTTKFNASTLISYNANDEVVYIDETFDGVTYRTTFTRSDMTVASTLPISAVTIL